MREAAKAEIHGGESRMSQMEAIVAEHETALLRYATRLTNNPFTAQDIVQNVFIKLFKGWKKGMRPSKQLRGWLYRVTHNEAVDHIRRESQRHILHNRHAEQEANGCPDGRNCPVTVDERKQAVLSHLRKLDPREQQAVVGLVQRRDEMRFNRNIQESGQLERMEEFKGGQFSADYAAKVQQSLPDQENQSLMQVAGKILEQQSAAERVSQAINITMPAHGRKLVFSRSLQIDPAADLIVSFKVSSGKMIRGLLVLIAVGVLLVVYRFGLGVWVRRSA